MKPALDEFLRFVNICLRLRKILLRRKFWNSHRRIDMNPRLKTNATKPDHVLKSVVAYQEMDILRHAGDALRLLPDVSQLSRVFDRWNPIQSQIERLGGTFE